MGLVYTELLKNQIIGASFNATPLLKTWSETMVMVDVRMADDDTPLDPDQNLLLEAYLLPEVPSPADDHPFYKDAICQNVSMEPETRDSTTNIRVTMQWAQPGVYCAVEFDAYQQTVSTTFDADHNLTTLSLTPAASMGSTLPKNPLVVRLNIPGVTHSIRVTQTEVNKTDTPRVISDVIADAGSQVFWNEDAIWGYAPGELLYVGARVATEGTSLYRYEYTFLVRVASLGGWSHEFSVFVQQDGTVPKEVVFLDPATVKPSDGTVVSKTSDGKPGGMAAFKILASHNFKDYFADIKPLFNKSTAA